MHLNPCKNKWELCLKEGLGIIGMQNKHVALETHGVFLPRPLQLNVCPFRHGLNSVPRHSRCRRPVGSWAMLPGRDPAPAQRVSASRGDPAEARSPACTPSSSSSFWGKKIGDEDVSPRALSLVSTLPHALLPTREITAVFTTLRKGFFHPGCTDYPHEYPWEQRGMFQRGFWKGALVPKAQQGRQGVGAGAVWGQRTPRQPGLLGPLE